MDFMVHPAPIRSVLVLGFIAFAKVTLQKTIGSPPGDLVYALDW
jgi:hypothetical protein